MNKILKIAGNFLETVDQRADRTVNAAVQPPSYKSRVSEGRNGSEGVPVIKERERYIPRNPKYGLNTARRAPVTSSVKGSSTKLEDTAKKDLEVDQLLKLLNTADDSIHKRATSEQLPQGMVSPNGRTRIIRQDIGEFSGRKKSNLESASPPSKPHPTEEDEKNHVWGDSDNEVGLHITASVDPSIENETATPLIQERKAEVREANPLSSEIVSIEEEDPATLRRIIYEQNAELEELDRKLVAADEEATSYIKNIEDKETRIDILENRIKQTRIDMDNDKEKNDRLFDEKDSMIMQLQQEIESMKANHYRGEVNRNEEVDGLKKSILKKDKEYTEVNTHVKELEATNVTLRSQIMSLAEEKGHIEEKYTKIIKEQESKVKELTQSLAQTQKQLEDCIMRFEPKEEMGNEMETKVSFLEKEMMKAKQENLRLQREGNAQTESYNKSIEEYKSVIKKYEDTIEEKTKKINEYESLNEASKVNKENSYSLLQNQIEQLQQIVLKKQLLLDASNSEKSSLEYRLADLLRDKARTESLQRSWNRSSRNEWKDMEYGSDENDKIHVRYISKLLPASIPSSILDRIDGVDDLVLAINQFTLRSPSFRLLLILYFLSIHIVLLVLFFRK